MAKETDDTQSTMPDFGEQASGSGQFLTFLSGKELFAVDILVVNEIIEVVDMTHVPKAPVLIRGVINLRGGVVPVIDLGAKLTGNISDLTPRSCVVLVTVYSGPGQQTLGLLVDEVREIVDVQASNIKPPPSLGDAVDTGFIKAMAQVNEHLIVLLDTDQVLSRHEVTQAGDIAQSPSKN